MLLARFALAILKLVGFSYSFHEKAWVRGNIAVEIVALSDQILPHFNFYTRN